MGKAHKKPRQVAQPFRNRLRHSFSGLALVRPWAQCSRRQGAWHGTRRGGEVHTPPIERRRQTTRHPQANGGAEGSTRAGMAVRVYGHGSFKGSQGTTTRLRIDNLRQPPTTRATTRQLDGAEAARAMAVATFLATFLATFRETFRETFVKP